MRGILTAILLFSTAILFACGGYFSSSNEANSNQANIAQANTDANENAGLEANIEVNTNVNITAPPKRPSPTVKPDPLTRPAPDDSVITAENNAEGDLVETRIFKNHDMVAKIERILPSSRRNGSVRVFLKNGKMYEMPVAKIKNALSESPEGIVRAIESENITTAAQTANRAQPDGRNGPGSAVPANAAATPRQKQ